MEPKQIYKEIKKDIKTDKKTQVLCLGDKSLLNALYIAGKARQEGINIKTKAIIPSNSQIRTEEKAKEEAEEKDTIMNGTPNTYYRIGGLEMEDDKYSIIIDERENNFSNLPETTTKLTGKKTIILTLPEKYLYPLKATYKGLIKTKEKLKNTKEILKEMNLKIETYKVTANKEILVKCTDKNFKQKAKNITPASPEEVAEKIIEECYDEVSYAREGSTFCVKSNNEKYLYHFEHIEENNSNKYTFQVTIRGKKTKINKPKKGRKGKKFQVTLYPSLNKYKEKIKDQGDLIIPKHRVKDYYS